jgi:hypothetical protein
MKKDKTKKPINLEGIYNALQAISISDRQHLETTSLSSMQKVANALSHSTPQLSHIEKEMYNIATEQVSKLGNLSLDLSYAETYNLMLSQIEAFLLIEQSYPTKMLKNIQNSLSKLDLKGCLEATNTALNRPFIEIADVAFLKLSSIDDFFFRQIEYPRGFATALSQLNVGTARRVVQCDDISYEPRSRFFVVSKKPSDKASSRELNVICSGADILDNLATDNDDLISESELISFLTVLSETPGFGIEDEVGQKILHIVRRVAECIDFDKDLYYHSRKLAQGQCPYPQNEMLSAPVGVTGPGRYNHPGRSYYYFADTQKGAETEVRKHCSTEAVQTAIISPEHSVRLLDLSGTMRGGTTFLRYIRFPVSNTNSNMPREYLIPCFVSDCCRRSEIDGIKYYGGAGYSNYVCWNDGHFCFKAMALPLM